MNVPAKPPKISLGEFSDALWNPESETPRGVIGPDGDPAPKRFSVYRNNVIVSLSEALEQTFPAILNLLGEDYFKALARAFVVRHPPKSPVLIWYGADFADFIKEFPPLEAYPYLADVARVEWAWVTAYHAADADALDPAVFGAVDPESLASVRFEKHPAANVIVSRWPVWDLLRANRFEPGTEIGVDITTPQSVLVARPGLDVELLLLRPGGDTFTTALLSGATLGEAGARASERAEAFSLSDCLSDCLSNGVFSNLIAA